ncbi:hypothetical protein KIL84_013989 [Mauremys mutica]|uniref:Uncharacterized protein n=1 Tax=Mauremys mutica TaxID=74926 RepID=A0A9D3WWF9_9SAUR|nr:hypothetical protein KIL84_013989 [Mauremys mutica]
MKTELEPGFPTLSPARFPAAVAARRPGSYSPAQCGAASSARPQQGKGSPSPLRVAAALPSVSGEPRAGKQTGHQVNPEPRPPKAGVHLDYHSSEKSAQPPGHHLKIITG